MKITVFAIIFFLTNISIETKWESYFEDEKIKISYTSLNCDDKQNGFNFEYYFIKIKNKTGDTLVVNFFKRPDEPENQEDKIAFVLKPYESKVGSCQYSPINLKIFKQENSAKISNFTREFALSKITVIEVY